MSTRVTILVEVEVILTSGESETRIVELVVGGPDEFIPRLLEEVRRAFTDNVTLPLGEHRIYVLSERDKPIRVTTTGNLDPLFRWKGIHFDNNFIQHKFRAQIIQGPACTYPLAPVALVAPILTRPAPVVTFNLPQVVTNQQDVAMVNESDSDSDDSIILLPVTAKKTGITVIKEGNVIIKTGAKCVKDLAALKKMLDERQIETTQQTLKLIGVSTGLDDAKVKKVMEYWDLSDTGINKDFTKEDIVKTVIVLIKRHNWDIDSVIEEEEDI